MLNFALGKAFDDLGEGEEAFKCYIEGNRLYRKTLSFNIADEKKLFLRFKKMFDRDFFKKREGFGCSDSTPIFILGMPRSGSTLIEQILSSHPDIFGAGELSFTRRIVQTKMSSNLDSMIPYTASRLKIDDVAKMGNEYVTRIRKLAPKAKFITDKMPANFLFIGMIKLMLPNAKIIHSVRSPEDTCLSIFKQNFIGTHDYAYDMTELGQYYRLYSDIMNHWHTQFPGVIYDIKYEHLIANQEDETRKLLKFCNVEWDDNCLNFHKTARDVHTASNVQVRQSIYSSSVAGWRRYEKQLQPLTNALGDLISINLATR